MIKTRTLVFSILVVIASDASSQEDPRKLTCNNINTTSVDYRIGLLVGVVHSVLSDALYHHASMVMPMEDMGFYERKLLAICALNPEVQVYDAAFVALFDIQEPQLHPSRDEHCDGPDWTKPIPADDFRANLSRICETSPRSAPKAEPNK